MTSIEQKIMYFKILPLSQAGLDAMPPGGAGTLNQARFLETQLLHETPATPFDSNLIPNKLFISEFNNT